MDKPTSGERIAAFMARLQVKEPTICIDVWRVKIGGSFTWRAQVFTEFSDNMQNPSMWETYYRFDGKSRTVVLVSRDKWTRAQVVAIADMIVKGKTVIHELIPRDHE